MIDELQNLGKLSPWQIKEFPETLREDITRQAKTERMTVGEFVTSHMVALRDAGWQREGLTVGKPFARPTVSLADLERAIRMACQVAEFSERMPKGMASLANRLVKDQLVSMRQTVKLPSGKLFSADVQAEVTGLQTVYALENATE